MIYKSILEMVGNTPLLELRNFTDFFKLKASLFAKLECFNPTGSAKDRIAKEMLLQAFEEGYIHKDTTIIEPTSGNTGIGIAAFGKAMHLKVIIVMPASMSKERVQLMKAYGAEVVLSDAEMGMTGAIQKAKELAKKIKPSFIPSQFSNPYNPLSHYHTTGPEIYRDLKGEIDVFICGIGTGGTISGVGKYLKEKNNMIQVIGVEPLESPVLSKGVSGTHKIEGIGAGFIPQTLNQDIYDEIMTISGELAIKRAQEFNKLEGILVGISSGAVLEAAIEYTRKKENYGKRIVVLLPDSADRYFSTDLFQTL